MKNSTVATTAPQGLWLSSGSRIVACAATWCGVHCALTPLLILAAPALALSEGIERAAWAITIILGTLMLALGPARRRIAVIVAFATGGVLWAASLAGWFEPIPEAVTSATGSLIVAAALFRSARLCRADDCEVCAEESG